jgi:hypothetical protein
MAWRLIASGLVVAAIALAGCDGGGDGGEGGTGGVGPGSGGSGATGGGGGGGGAGGGGGEGGSSGSQCGGIAGLMCADDQYCDYHENACGVGDGLGTCKPRPQGCPDVYMPVCGCDGVVYGNECDANGAGQDVSDLGGCQAPQGMFACGSMFCASGQQYCQRAVSDVAGTPDIFGCMPMPIGCDSCQCLANEPCGAQCEQLPTGDFLLTCPGG